MALRTIVVEGDEILRKKSKEVKNFGERTHMLLDDMWETMREADGVGLAAPQVGVLRRAVVIDVTDPGGKDEGEGEAPEALGGPGAAAGPGGPGAGTGGVRNGAVDGPAGPPASPAASATPAEPAAPLTPVTPDTPDTPPAPPASVTPDTPDTQAAPPASVTPDTPAAPVNAPDGFLFELLNPVVVASDGETFEREGCLSVPGVSGLVKRPERVTVKAYDRDGNEVVVEGEGILAKALCHEIDHLEGVLFTDIAEEVETLGQREAEELEGSE